jgi:hypothetical protein
LLDVVLDATDISLTARLADPRPENVGGVELTHNAAPAR